jgi:pimeloyl-ACP methyl ester carboxylesterase
MITSPNAYWLHFFLRREINVVCWNYRGYGESEASMCNWLGPYESKRDVERVFAYCVNNLRLKGKLGVYGRSIGGIAACHLAAKYDEWISCMVIDRSLTELRDVAIQKLGHSGTGRVFDFISSNWQCHNT